MYKIKYIFFILITISITLNTDKLKDKLLR